MCMSMRSSFDNGELRVTPFWPRSRKHPKSMQLEYLVARQIRVQLDGLRPCVVIQATSTVGKSETCFADFLEWKSSITL